MGAYTVENKGAECTVLMQGDLLVGVVGELKETLKSAIEGGAKDIIVDFSSATMLDSSGIGLLVAVSNSLAVSHGRVRLVNVSESILKLLQSMRLATRLNATGK